MTTLLLILSIILLLYLSLYALIFISLSVAAFFISPRSPERTDLAPEAITVLIPAYNEGAGVIDAIIAVREQDYAADIAIKILIKDEADNSWPELAIFLQNEKMVSKRQIELIKTGYQTKKDKLNFALRAVTTPLVAILDADQRPTSNWLTSSFSLMTAENVAAVQTRRRPLGLKHLAQIWDSVQNHFGNELLNKVLAASGRSVFFTGTAAVFKTEIIRRFNLSDSVTEDTYLAYDLLTNGYKTLYNDAAASYEEVSPSFKDYIFRRRRWSAGHNQTFFNHLKRIIQSPLPVVDKFILLAHGQFYLIPVVVWWLISIYGLYFFGQLGHNFQFGVVMSALFFGALLAYTFRQAGRRLGGDWLIASLWFFPQLAIWAVFVYRLIGAENYYYILIFPYARQSALGQIILFLAPLLIIFSSFYYFKDSRKLRNLWVAPTYIFTLFLDIYAGLLGFWDFIWGRAYWSQITRRNSYSAELLPPELQANFLTGRPLKRPSRLWVTLILSSTLFILVLNDLSAVNNCGEIKYFLWRPLIFKSQSNLDWRVKLEKTAAADNQLKLTINSDLTGPAAKYRLNYYIDGQPVGAAEISGGEVVYSSYNYPLGWVKHAVTVDLRGETGPVFCRRQLSFATTLKELRGRDLYINQEKFLIKGLIPSFNNNQLDLSLAAGLAQIKASGANTVRFYHEASDALLQAAANNQLLVIDQPDRSTWNELNLKSQAQITGYTERYQSLVKKHAGEPYVLWDGLGNEWELGDQSNPARAINLTDKILKELAQTVSAPLTSYSTYYTFLKYPVDISGINMLDTGETYWRKALNLIVNTGKPFYASEFGGFVAFWEKTDSELRMNRLLREWSLLIKAGALGANFYESHDNWAQPVVTGYNDPFKNDQPDDARGFWDNNNQAKPELKLLQKIFADLSVVTSESVISDYTQPLSLSVKNIREYNLKQVKLTWTGGAQDLGDFKPGESKTIKITLSSDAFDDPLLVLRFTYTSHAGLGGVSQINYPLPLLRNTPVILNDDFENRGRGADYASGRLIYSNELDLILPTDWQKFTLNGQAYEKTAPRLKIPLANPYQELTDLEFSQDGQIWHKATSDSVSGGGRYFFRFHWPQILAAKQSLILAGLGSSQVEFITAGLTYSIPVHSYRENQIELDQLNNPSVGDLITFKINRDQIVYIDKARAVQGLTADFDLSGDIKVDFERPRIFAPLDIELKKGR